MPNPLNVFISYRTTALGKLAAERLFTELSNRKFKPFWDKKSIEGGMEWDEKIYKSVMDSEVLIVLLEDDVVTSDWVPREVDIARAAQIQILPLMLDSKEPEKVLKRLALDKYHFIAYGTEFDHDKLCDRLTELAEITRQEQRQRIESLLEKWKKKPAANNLAYGVYQLRNTQHDTRIYLATGSMHEFKGIDVLVNSENDHLQMSRIHENYTVSSRLRLAGSWTKTGSTRILEDTVQWELDTQADALEEGRPVDLCTIFPTNAGHPKSVLRQRNKVRYIFHAVTVSVFAKHRKQTMIPIETDEGIKECVWNCLDQVEKVNLNSGIISAPSLIMSDGRQPYQEEVAAAQDYQPITSIAFPIFGSGHGGRKVRDVIVPMLEAVRNFLSDNPKTSLTNIYICAYSEDDIAPVRDAMNVIFDPVL